MPRSIAKKQTNRNLIPHDWQEDPRTPEQAERVHNAHATRFEALVEYNRQMGVEDDILWAMPTKRK